MVVGDAAPLRAHAAGAGKHMSHGDSKQLNVMHC